MRIISFNANGIRAAARKGFFEWLARQDADVVCIQELKAQQHQLEGDDTFFPEGYHCFYEEATNRKGYSGVALYARREPDELIRGMGHEEFDAEGRYIEARFGNLAVASLYAPSGSSGDHRQASKDRYLAYFLPYLERRKAAGDDFVLCGDLNIAHKEIDLKNWRSNRKNSGFLPYEREWMDRLFDEVGYVDAFRAVNPNPDEYTWWSNRGRAWEKNVGWRIDYHIVTPGLADRIEAAYVYREERLSDHAPLTLDYDYDF
ncbi:exodeoxyribonuclease III Xth [Salinisphaera sp. PC39]|uniref:exodeoxyribonuclease III n=1 Tax=Salinisphaera sp. PC39 TaxID=1304156 RepID=UPI003342BCFE